MKQYFLHTLLLVGLISCQKEEVNEPSQSPNHWATFNVMSPQSGATYVKGDTLTVFFTVNAERELHEVGFFLDHLDRGVTLQSYGVHTHDKQPSFTQEVILPEEEMNARIRAVITDHNGKIIEHNTNFLIK